MSALHALCEGKPSDVHWQQGRSWLLGENGGMGGCRQRHTQSHGYYLWDTFYKSPHSYSKPWRFPAINSACIFWPTLYPALSLHRSSEVSSKSRAAPMDLEPTILAVLSSNADSLVSVNDPDTMTNEPMWPTDKEMCGADADQLSVEASIGVF